MEDASNTRLSHQNPLSASPNTPPIFFRAGFGMEGVFFEGLEAYACGEGEGGEGHPCEMPTLTDLPQHPWMPEDAVGIAIEGLGSPLQAFWDAELHTTTQAQTPIHTTYTHTDAKQELPLRYVKNSIAEDDLKAVAESSDDDFFNTPVQEHPVATADACIREQRWGQLLAGIAALVPHDLHEDSHQHDGERSLASETWPDPEWTLVFVSRDRAAQTQQTHPSTLARHPWNIYAEDSHIMPTHKQTTWLLHEENIWTASDLALFRSGLSKCCVTMDDVEEVDESFTPWLLRAVGSSNTRHSPSGILDLWYTIYYPLVNLQPEVHQHLSEHTDSLNHIVYTSSAFITQNSQSFFDLISRLHKHKAESELGLGLGSDWADRQLQVLVQQHELRNLNFDEFIMWVLHSIPHFETNSHQWEREHSQIHRLGFDLVRAFKVNSVAKELLAFADPVHRPVGEELGDDVTPAHLAHTPCKELQGEATDGEEGDPASSDVHEQGDALLPQPFKRKCPGDAKPAHQQKRPAVATHLISGSALKAPILRLS